MSKVKIKSLLLKDNVEILNIHTNGIYNKNQIFYNENGTKIQIKIYEDHILLIRKRNDGTIVELNFNLNEIAVGQVKYGGYESKIEIKTLKLIKKEYKIEIEYIIIGDEEKYRYLLSYNGY